MGAGAVSGTGLVAARRGNRITRRSRSQADEHCLRPCLPPTTHRTPPASTSPDVITMSRAADRNTAPAPPSPISTTSPVPRCSADSTKGMSVTEQHSVWRATRLYWHNRTPGMGLVDSNGTERTYPVLLGTSVGYQLGGQRCCTGVWLAQQRRRRPCPFGHPIPPPATRSQCDPCGSADPGTMLARNTILDDEREYVLYLAWLARSRLPELRTAEQRISTSGLAPERRQRRVTRHLVATPGPHPTPRRTQHRLPTDHRGGAVAREPGPRGLHGGRPGRNVRPRRAPRFLPGDHHPGQGCGAQRNRALRNRAGSPADTPDGPLLADTRLLTGWPLHPTTAAPTGLQLRACDDAHSDDAATQASLF